MKVKCIDDKGYKNGLTKGTIYEGEIVDHNNYFMIGVNDLGKKSYQYYIERFIKVKE